MTMSQYLTFSIADEQYAIGILKVREIVACDVLTPVPRTPGFVRGVMNLRGNVVPVMDLAVKLELPPTELGARSCVVIVEAELSGESATVGLLTDSVNDVVELKEGQEQPPPRFGTRIDLEFLLAVASLNDQFVPILDVDKLLAELERITARKIAGAA